jgi:hypothetical protein
MLYCIETIRQVNLAERHITEFGMYCPSQTLSTSFHLGNMAPVPLPPPLSNNLINLPPQVHDPPLDHEVIQTRKLFDNVRVAHGNNRACSW